MFHIRALLRKCVRKSGKLNLTYLSDLNIMILRISDKTQSEKNCISKQLHKIPVINNHT